MAHIKKADKRSKAKKQNDFLIKLEAYASVTRACNKSKVPRRTIYNWLEEDPDFKKQFDKSCEIAVASLEDEAVRRAFEGTRKPVYQRGEKVGSIKEYSDTLLIVLLKARAPEKYKDRFEHTGKGGEDLFKNKTDGELAVLLKETLTKLDGKHP